MRRGPSPRFRSPPTEPDVRVCHTRLSHRIRARLTAARGSLQFAVLNMHDAADGGVCSAACGKLINNRSVRHDPTSLS
jgi:hypothetical protein